MGRKMKNIIFVHGLESSSKGFKALYLKKIIPEMLTPDFEKFDHQITLEELFNIRMILLNRILKERKKWVIIGSSFGGLMVTLFSLQNPQKVKRLILLAPFFATNLIDWDIYAPIDIPVIIYHGRKDKVAKLEPSKEQAHKLFTKLEFNATEDDHNLNQTVEKLNWIGLTS